jgi:hypothetical protein
MVVSADLDKAQRSQMIRRSAESRNSRSPAEWSHERRTTTAYASGLSQVPCMRVSISAHAYLGRRRTVIPFSWSENTLR